MPMTSVPGDLFPPTRTPLWIVLGLMALQTLWYYPRLPDQIVCKWDLSRDPSRWCGKGLLMGSVLLVAGASTALTFVAAPFLAWPLTGVLLFITVVNQYVVAANPGDGRLHGSFFWVVAAFVPGVLTFVFGVAR